MAKSLVSSNESIINVGSQVEVTPKDKDSKDIKEKLLMTNKSR